MHMAFNRLPMFAMKPAPVQATWLAYPGGTGLRAIDYRISDAQIDPMPLPSLGTPGEGKGGGSSVDSLYSERSIRLPDCWCCYHPLGDVPPTAAPSGPVTFGSLTTPAN